MPRFIYTDHAKDRMVERRVSEAEVEQCVSGATTTYRGSATNEYRAVVAGRRIKVVTIARKDNDRVKVVKTVIDEDQEES